MEDALFVYSSDDDESSGGYEDEDAFANGNLLWGISDENVDIMLMPNLKDSSEDQRLSVYNDMYINRYPTINKKVN